MRYFYVIGRNTSPYFNLAFERKLLAKAAGEDVILFLWQNNNTIVLGKNQDAHRECRIEEFLKDGGTLARRLSGGGAVYHDLGNLNYSLIGGKGVMERHPGHELMMAALRKNGLEAEFNGRNDLLVEGRKVSGSAFYVSGNAQCLHGTLLVHTDIGKMERYLTPDREKLLRNSVGSVGARVANLTDFSETITVGKLCETLVETADAYPLQAGQLPVLTKEDVQKFSAKDWIYGGKFL